ncbi:DUF4870 domain-containing protein [Sporosarcina obsidiansis]|uniref:DUF4870 domain-containing protein n=1 Tax=Sporosarcina obsidiansis TaxID=2660748 RepID=UPI00129B78FB|nr:DUF4870 domain-containing protein [Sporosarcina obsidiansis]
MSNKKLLSSLCYFSIFFAPLLLPAIIYFVTDEFEVRRHAKKSLISHIIPMALLIAGFIILSFSIFSFNTQSVMSSDGNFMFWGIVPFLFIALYSALFFVVLIWNVYQGIKVLK